MKSNIFKIAALAAVILVTAACHDAKYSVIENMLYISEAAPESGTPQQVENLTITGDVSTTIHARIAQPLDYDVTVNIGLAPEFVDEYNAMYGTEYLVLTDDLFSYDSQAVITAGNVMSGDITISVKDFTADETYCIPLKITSNDGCVEITENTSRIMFVLATPLIQYVPIMDYKPVPSGGGDWGISTQEWTLEGWVWMSSFSVNNQAIFNGTCSQGTEIYIRFGDADVAYNKLQIKTYGSQFNSNTVFATNTWYHVAFTCGAGKVIMYINGEEDSSMDISGNDYVIENLQLCSSGSTYFRANAKMAQVRLWTSALSQSLIQKNMNGSVPATSAGLVGYWKLDEGEGDVFYDSTSNGRDLTCSSSPTWSDEPVNFSNPNE
ncbi:MAG: DUF1735 and LamG domain-containing protein [Bacteroidales bacterium]|nr:DUF1735 and LamG domain-containing protein [Bacteroidales bacterium]